MRAGRTRKQRARRMLRGGALTASATHALAHWGDFERPEKLTWEALAKHLGVSRQAVATKEEIKSAYEAAKERLRQPANQDLNDPAVAVRRGYQERIAALERELEQLRRDKDKALELWTKVQVNAARHGWDADLLLAPLPKPLRDMPHTSRGIKRKKR